MPCWPRLATSGLLAAALAGGAAQAQVLEPDPGVRAALMDAVSEADSFEHPFDAEVWLLDMSTRLTAYNAAYDDGLDILRVAHRAALRAELPPELVLAVIDIESRFDKFAISHAGALGLMQIMPFGLDEIGRPNDNLFQVETNLRYGCAILKHYLDRENGDLTRALARYNGSLGKTWYPERVLEALSSRWYQR